MRMISRKMVLVPMTLQVRMVSRGRDVAVDDEDGAGGEEMAAEMLRHLRKLRLNDRWCNVLLRFQVNVSFSRLRQVRANVAPISQNCYRSRTSS